MRMRIREIVLVVVIGAAAAFAIAAAGRDTHSRSREASPLDTMVCALVVGCTDGDTYGVTIGIPPVGIGTRETVRLLGVDAPELGSDGVRGDNAVRAMKYARRRLSHRTVYLSFDRRIRDSFGRLLAYVYLDDGGCFNAELIRKGLACIYTGTDHRLFEEFKELQYDAMRRESGMWGALPQSVVILFIFNRGTEEHVVVKNNTGQAVDLSGWYLTDESDNLVVIPDGAVLGAGEMLYVHSGSGGIDYPPHHLYVSRKNIWDNTGDSATLFTAGGARAAAYSY